MICAKSVAYVSGPMTGYPDANRPAFEAAEELLRQRFGCEVLNPARWPDGLSWQQYMRLDVAMLRRASVVVVLPGWQQSRGAMIEVELARMHGTPVVEVGDVVGAHRADFSSISAHSNPCPPP